MRPGNIVPDRDRNADQRETPSPRGSAETRKNRDSARLNGLKGWRPRKILCAPFLSDIAGVRQPPRRKGRWLATFCCFNTLATLAQGAVFVTDATFSAARSHVKRASMTVTTAVTNGFDFDIIHHAIAVIRRKQVFFVGGAAKSGTTWLQFLLNAHPDISCSGEGHFPNKLLPGLGKALNAHNATINLKSQSIFDGLNEQPLFTNRHALYLATAAISMLLCPPAKANIARIVGDKTPDNVRHFALLATLFPQAKFIHIVRDARDCAVSAWFHNKRVTPEPFAKQFTTFAEFSGAFAQAWVTNVSLGAQFTAEQPDRCLAIRYEDLSQDPFRVFNQMCEFLGASTEPAILRSCCAAADFANLSGGRRRGQEDRGSFFRQGLPGNWREHFDAPAEFAYREKVEPWLSRFRY
jgi:hypothetical protein